MTLLLSDIPDLHLFWKVVQWIIVRDHVQITSASLGLLQVWLYPKVPILVTVREP